MWVLVAILLNVGEPEVYKVGMYNTMLSCFEKREEIWERYGEDKSNFQVVCIRMNGKADA